MGDVYPKVCLAAVQASPIFLNREATVEKACDLILEAGNNGADFVAFPENFISGHPVWFVYNMSGESEQSMRFAMEFYKNSVEIPSEAVNKICQAASRAGVYVVMGMSEKKPNQTGTTYNTQLFINREGQIIGKHQKLHSTMTEMLVQTGGSGKYLKTVQTELGPVSGLICGENFNPFAVGVLAAEYTRIHCSAWPPHFMIGHGWAPMRQSIEIASRNIAYTCKAFVISSAATVNDEMLDMLCTNQEEREFFKDPKMTGGSIIVNPAGNIIAGPMDGDKEGILYADVDLDECVFNHYVHDFGGYYNRADVFRLFVNDTEDELVTRVPSAKNFFRPEEHLTTSNPFKNENATEEN